MNWCFVDEVSLTVLVARVLSLPVCTFNQNLDDNFSCNFKYRRFHRRDCFVFCFQFAVFKGRFTHSMPCPCRPHAIPCRWGFRICLFHLIYTVRLCLSHTCHAMSMPRPCHALTMPFFSRPRYNTAIERRPVGYLPAFGFFRLPRGVPQRLLSEAYQSSSQRSIPTTVKGGSSTLQKKTTVKLLD
jgi:hypothetical protein